MPAVATTSSLSNYLKLNIATYRDQLRHTNADSIKVSYSHRGNPYSYSIRLEKTACNFGGVRYWWSCPQCSGRTTVLYCKGTYVCRHCINAPYGSQLQQPIDRLFSRLNAIRARMQWQKGIIHGIGERPEGMHLKTYEKLVNEHDRLSADVWQATLEKLNCIG